MRAAERERFDARLEDVLATLPRSLLALLDEAPLIVEDLPDPELLASLGMDPQTESLALCGLHSGTPLGERITMEGHDHPETIHLFRAPIILAAGGWAAGGESVREEIRITLLHEIGHHFGFEEDDLEALGYG